MTNDDICRIDGQPCDRAAKCKMKPFDVCYRFHPACHEDLTYTACRRCLAYYGGQCPGFRCYLRPNRPIHPSNLAAPPPIGTSRNPVAIQGRSRGNRA